jgi:hypothetical protein
MTKEELLQKGVSEDVADEIVAAFDETGSSNSLLLLEKALNKDDGKQESLFKAEEMDDDDDDEEGYDEAYMKKYMRKYMMANKKSCGKMAKELGIAGEEMKKAMDDFSMDAEGAVIEMADLAPILESQLEFNERMAKAIEEISGQINLISAQAENGFDIMAKAARVQVEQAKALDTVLSTPQGRKGVTANVDMTKAIEPVISPEQNKLVYSVLMKAVQSGDAKAGQIISVFESAGRNIQALTPEHKNYVNNLLAK